MNEPALALVEAPMDPETKRIAKVAQLRAAGYTGGGPECPWSDCRARALDPMENDDRHQCRVCRRGARVRVTKDGISVERVEVRPAVAR